MSTAESRLWLLLPIAMRAPALQLLCNISHAQGDDDALVTFSLLAAGAGEDCLIPLLPSLPTALASESSFFLG